MSSRQLKFLFISTIFLFCSLIQIYGQEANWKGSKNEIDGVVVVKNPKKPMYGVNVFNLDEELSIGEPEARDEYMFLNLRGLNVDDNGLIYALDTKVGCVKVYDDKARYKMTIGRKGQGPGEFQFPMEIQISPKNELVIKDMNKISYFTMEGEFIRSRKCSATRFARFEFDKFSNLYGISIIFGASKVRFELNKFSPEFDVIHTIDSFSELKSNSLKFDPFSPFIKYNMIKGEYVVFGGIGEDYKIKICDLDGKLMKTIQTDYDPTKVTERDIEVEMQWHVIESKDSISTPIFKPPYRRIYADDEGRIIISTWELIPKQHGYYYDIYDPEGRYLVQVQIPGDHPVFKKGKLYSVTQDEHGYQYVKRYKVTWNY